MHNKIDQRSSGIIEFERESLLTKESYLKMIVATDVTSVKIC
jgi:hypothetical protein